MIGNTTLTNLYLTTTDAGDLDALARQAPTTDDLLKLADWLGTNGAAHLSAIARIELAERLITRRRFLIGAGVLGLGVITGCGAEEEAVAPTGTAEMHTVVDAYGNEVVIPTNPQRIIAADPTATVALLELGVVPVAGGAVEGLFPEAGEGSWHPYHYALGAGEMTTFSRNNTSFELLAQQDADLILIPKYFADRLENLDDYEQIAPTVVIDTSEGVVGAVQNAAAVIGRTERAQELLDFRKYQLQGLAQDVSFETLSIAHTSEGGNFFAFTDDNVTAALIADLLGVKIVPDSSISDNPSDQGGAYVSIELLGELSGDVLLETFYFSDTPLSSIPVYDTLPAVQAERVVTEGFDAGVLEGSAGLVPQVLLLTEIIAKLVEVEL